MDIRSAFPSKFVKAADLQGREVRVTIGQVVMEVMNDGKTKPVVYFTGRERGLALNKVNANTIEEMYGPDTNNWIGKGVELFPTKVDLKGERVDAIRIRCVQPPPMQPKQKPEPERMYGNR
jgi:hypothetical protein